MAERAKALGFFERVFGGSEPPEAVLAYLKRHTGTDREDQVFPQSMIERIRWKSPFPILRHHFFSLPRMEATVEGIPKIADGQVLDVISLGIDQDAQENFSHTERQDPRRRKAGGVPVRSEKDYRSLNAASSRGNLPLMRTYSGMDDFIHLAEMYVETIHIAWAAIFHPALTLLNAGWIEATTSLDVTA